MVQILAPFFILSVISGTCLSLTLPAKRVTTVIPKDVEEDFENITTSIKRFDESVDAFCGSMEGALDIDKKAHVAVAALRNGTKDVNSAPPFTEDESHWILRGVKYIAPTITDSLLTIVAKKSMFEKLNVAGDVRDGLQFMERDTNDFMTALTLKAAPDSRNCFKAYRKTFAEEFEVAIEAFK